MKQVMAILILCAAAVCAPAADDKKSTKHSTAPATVTIPKDAVRNENGTYSYTDKDGKKWLYTNTPFGVVKAADGAEDKPDKQPPAVKVIDKGDTVRFERPSPFGTMSWEKKKSDLTDEERKLVDAQNP